MSEPDTDKYEDIAALIRDVDVRAPDELHEHVARMVADATGARGSLGARLQRDRAARAGRSANAERPRVRRSVAWRGSLALGVAAIIAVVAVAAIGGFSSASGQPSVLRAAARLTLAAASEPAPAEQPPGGGRLAAQVEGVAFPYWEGALGWRATGMRTDTLAGRSARTVYYTDAAGRRVGYTIVSGLPAPAAAGGKKEWRDGTEYRLIRVAGVPTVVWLRDGRLCVVSGRGVAGSTLVTLASWERPAVATTPSPA